MIHKGLLNIIRRMALQKKLSIREISRRTGWSRNTITKHLNAGAIEAQFTTPDRHGKLDPFADKLTGWLKAEAGTSRKQRRTLKQLHSDLVVLGLTRLDCGTQAVGDPLCTPPGRLKCWFSHQLRISLDRYIQGLP